MPEKDDKDQKKQRRRTRNGPAQEAVEALQGFTGAVTGYTEALQKSVVKAGRRAENEPVARLLESTAGAIHEQMARVMRFTEEHAEQLSDTQLTEIGGFLATQTAPQFVTSTQPIMERGINLGWGREFMKWLLKHLQEIKKIGKEILKQIFKALGIPFPEWLDTIFQYLDELKEVLLELLDILSGGDGEGLAAQLSAMEVRYLNEMAALERLQQATPRARYDSDEDR